MSTLESIIKSLIDPSFKLDLTKGLSTGSNYRPVKKPKKDRVFGILPSFLLSVLVASIPFWVMFWPEIPEEGFKIVTNREYAYELQIPTPMEAFENQPNEGVYGVFLDPADLDGYHRVIVVSGEKLSTDMTAEQYFSQFVGVLEEEYRNQNFRFIESYDDELDIYPAKSFIYETDFTDLKDDGSSFTSRVRTKTVVLVQKGEVIGLSLTDNIESFDRSLSDFTVSKDSFYYW